MSVRIAWTPSTYPYIASYDIERAAVAGGPYTFLVNILHEVPGANYDNASLMLFYADTGGQLSNWYRLTSIDTSDNRSAASSPMQPTGDIPVFTNTVKVDHNYGSPGALRYQTAAGAPIEGALIRVYTKTNFDQGITGAPLAVTLTDASGNWINPVSLTTGLSYVVQFAKEGLYGPNSTEIVV